MQLVLRGAISAVALYVTVYILDAIGLAKIVAESFTAWLAALLAMGFVNALIRPLARLITAPLNCLTFGLVGIVVNVLLFALVPWLTRALGVPVFELTAPGAILGSILVGLLGGLLSRFIIKDRED